MIVQKRPQSLVAHLDGYSNGVAQMRGQFIHTLSPPREEERFFASDVDSFIQLRGHLVAEGFDIVLITMADQVVKIDYRQVIESLLEGNADAVMVYNAMPVKVASGALGVMEVDSDDAVMGMEEKPREPKEIPGRPGFCVANLAMYAVKMDVFGDMLDYVQGHHEPESTLSNSGIPWLIKNRKVLGYDLGDNVVVGASEREKNYFADTGTVDAWFDVQMKMCGRNPAFNFYSRDWPIYTAPRWPMSSAKVDDARHISEVLFGWGVICEDRVVVEKSVVSTGVNVRHDSSITNCVILDGADIGPGCALDRVVIEKNIKIPAGTKLSPLDPPDSTIKFADLYAKIKAGETCENTPVLTDGGALVFPKFYKF